MVQGNIYQASSGRSFHSRTQKWLSSVPVKNSQIVVGIVNALAKMTNDKQIYTTATTAIPHNFKNDLSVLSHLFTKTSFIMNRNVPNQKYRCLLGLMSGILGTGRSKHLYFQFHLTQFPPYPGVSLLTPFNPTWTQRGLDCHGTFICGGLSSAHDQTLTGTPEDPRNHSHPTECTISP